MYFLRWIAGYPILIILLVVGLYALYNKDNLSHWFEKNEATVQTSESEYVGEHVASIEETAPPKVETEGQAERKPGSWLGIFKGKKTEAEKETETASLPVKEEQATAPTEATVPAKVETAKVEKEGKAGSWLDIFKSKKIETETEAAPPPVEEEKAAAPTEAAVSAEVETAAKAEVDRYEDQMMQGSPAMPEMDEMPPMPAYGEMPPLSEMRDIPPMPAFGDVPPMPEMRDFPPMEPFPEMPMEPAFVPPMMDEPAEMMAPPTMDENMEKAASGVPATAEAEAKPSPDAEIAKVEKEEKSGSWLDIFKKKAEPEEASPSVQQDDAPVATTEVESSADVETAKVEEEKSGSWLDIFKREKEEEPATGDSAETDTSGGFQQQQNTSLRLAREAFWQRDFDAAEAIYKNMTKAEPENAGLLGEYGNVLLEAGKMDQALDVYEQVAELLIAQGRTFELRPLLYFIGDQDPERAQKLTQKIQSQQETNK